MRIQEKRIELWKKVHRRICVREVTFLAARSPYVIFSRRFCLFQFYVEQKFVPENGGGLAPPPSVYSPDSKTKRLQS